MNKDTFLDPLKTTHLFALNSHLDELIDLHNISKFPKSTLISGKKGIGKFTMINHFINYIYEKNTYDLKNKIIDGSSETFMKVQNEAFPNFIHIKNDGLNKVKIDDIRSLKDLISKSSILNGPRFIIFDDVEKLNHNSANSLLKIIEEPSENNYFILINNQQNSLLETISSRCLIKKIFVSNKKRIDTIEKLIISNNIEDTNFDYIKTDITPGAFLNYNQICTDHKITKDLNYFSKLDRLLKLYKKIKDKNLINISIYITEYYFYNLSIKYQNHIFNDKKNEMINQINDFATYNLNINSVLQNIHSETYYAK